MSKCRSKLCQSDAYSSGLCEYHLNHKELVIHTEGIGLAASNPEPPRENTKSAQSNKADTNDISEELLALPIGNNKPLAWDMDVLVDYVSTKIAQETNKARLDELRLLASKLADRKPRETWKAWSWRVTDEMKVRLAQLTAHKEETE